jgi:hypothetical protein
VRAVIMIGVRVDAVCCVGASAAADIALNAGAGDNAVCRFTEVPGAYWFETIMSAGPPFYGSDRSSATKLWGSRGGRD